MMTDANDDFEAFLAWYRGELGRIRFGWHCIAIVQGEKAAEEWANQEFEVLSRATP